MQTELPYDLSIEKAVLASLLLEGLCDESMGWLLALKPGMFFEGFHRKAFEAIAKLSAEGKDIDLVSVSSIIGRDSQTRLLDIQSTIASTAETDTWIAILKDRWARRELITRCGDAASQARNMEMPITEVCGHIEAEVLSIGTSTVDHAALTSGEVLSQATREIRDDFNRLASGEESGRRVKHCVPWFDEKVFAEREGVIVLTAYQGTGKTALALQTFAAQFMNGLKVAYFCTETKATALSKKLAATMAGISYRDAIEPRDPQKVARLAAALKRMAGHENNFALWGSIEVNWDLDVICYMARRAKARLGGLDMIYIDHLGDLKLPVEFRRGKQRQDEGIAENVQKIKRLAGQLDCAVTLLAQLDKSSRQKKRPGAGDLRGSSVIVDVASLIHFLYDTRREGEAHSNRREIEWYSEKSRDEGGFTCKLMFDGPTRSFAPISRFSRADDPPSEDRRAGNDY